MSFITSIQGNPPPNTFVYTTTTVSVNSVSATNASIINASIDNLTTLVFTPVNVNSSNVYALQADIVELNSSTVNSSTVNSSLVATNDIVADIGTVNTLTAGNLFAFDGNMSYLNVSNLAADTTTFVTSNTSVLNVSYISVLNMSAGDMHSFNMSSVYMAATTLNASTANASTLNASTINSHTLDSYNISSIYCSSTNLSCWNLHSLFHQTDSVYFKENASAVSRGLIEKRGQVLQMSGGTTAPGSIAFSTDKINYNMSYDGTLNVNSVANLSTVNASHVTTGTIHAMNMSLFSGNVSYLTVETDLNVSVINTSNVSADNVQTSTLYAANSSGINASIQNIWSSYQDTHSILFTSTIGSQSSAEIHRQGASMFIDGGSTAGAHQPGDILFSTDKINYNMSYDGNLNVNSVANLSSVNANAASVTTLTVFNTSVVNGDITNLTSDVIEADSLNASSVYFDSTDVAEPTAKIVKTNDVLEVSGGTTTDPGALAFSTDRVNFNLTYDGTDLNMNGTVNASTITGDISANLAAGTNITLTTVAGVTTINSSGGGGGVVDPLNISVGNISTLNTSDSTCDGTLTTANLVAGNLDAFNSNMSYLNVSTVNAGAINGFIKSTQYMFQTTSSYGSVSVGSGSILQFNAPTFVYPSASAYNATAGNFSYTCQVDGVYSFGFHLYLINAPSDLVMEIAIYKNGVIFASGGSRASFTEDVETLADCVAGDVFNVRVAHVSGATNIYLTNKYAWWYGYLLEPTNVAINAGTDLTVATIGATTVNTSQFNTSYFNAIGANVDSFTSDFVFINSDTGSAPAVLKKVADDVRLYAGNTTAPGTISLSVDNVSYPLTFDGDLQLATAANISTINCSTINTDGFGATNNLVGKSSIYSRYTSSQVQPGGITIYYQNFQSETYANTDLFTYVTPTNAGSAGQGFVCQKAGYYKIDYSIICFSVTYYNRVQWYIEPLLNNAVQVGRSWGYSRSGVVNNGYVWSCNCGATIVLNFNVGDYFGFRVRVAKNDSTIGDDFNSLGLDSGSVCTLQYLGS